MNAVAFETRHSEGGARLEPNGNRRGKQRTADKFGENGSFPLSKNETA
jgi:hypothetical protein